MVAGFRIGKVDQVVELGHQFRQIADPVPGTRRRWHSSSTSFTQPGQPVVARPEFLALAFAEIVAQGGKRTSTARAEHGGHTQRHHQAYAGINFRCHFAGAGIAEQRVYFREQHLQAPQSRAAPGKDLRIAGGEGHFRLSRRALASGVRSPASVMAVISAITVSPAIRKLEMGARAAQRHARAAPGAIFRKRCRGDVIAKRRLVQIVPATISINDLAVLSSCASALMVRSRRRRSCSSVTSGAHSKRWPV